MTEIVRIRESKARYQGAQKGLHKANITLTPYQMQEKQEKPDKGYWAIKIQETPAASGPVKDEDELQQVREKDCQFWKVDDEIIYFNRQEYAQNFLESFKTQTEI